MESKAWLMEKARKYVNKAGFSEIMDLAYERKYQLILEEEKRKEEEKKTAILIQ